MSAVPQTYTVDGGIREYLYSCEGLSERTVEWYTQKLTVFQTWCRENGVTQLADVDQRVVRRFQAHLRGTPSQRTYKPITDRTLHGYTQVVKGFLSWCVEDGLLTVDVSRRVEMPRVEEKVVQTFTRDQLTRLFEATQKEPTASLEWRDRAVLTLLLDTGLRASELCVEGRVQARTGLLLEDVHLDGRDAYIRVRGKGRKQRTIGLGREARRTLHTYLHRHRHATANCQHFITTRYGEPLTIWGLDEMLVRLRDWTGQPALFRSVRVSAHTFRHTFAVSYLRAGGDIYQLSLLLGHSSVKTTEIYLKDYKATAARAAGISVLDSLGR